MSEAPAGIIQPLIEVLRTTLTLEVRTAPASGDYLEAVLQRPELRRCHELLSNTLGAPVKEFNKAASFDAAHQRAVNGIGGIRLEQCLFLKPYGDKQAAYAALWPWASDPKRVTLKLGILALG